MRGKLSLQTVLGLIFVTVFMWTVTVAAQDVQAKTNQPQSPVQESQKVDPTVTNKDQLSRELVGAIMQGKQEEAKTLLLQGADVNFRLFRSMTILHVAAGNGNNQGIAFLLGNGALIDARDENGCTPLHVAAGAGFPRRNRSTNVIKVLLDKGADINAKDNNGFTPLCHAVARNLIGIVEYLLSQNAATNVADKYGLTPLHYAAAEGRKEMVVMLLEHDALVDVKDNGGRTPLHYAAGALGQTAFFHPQDWSIDIARILLEKKASINVQDTRGWSPLYYAIYNLCHKPTVKLLLNKGADTDCRDSRGYTPYSYLLYFLSYSRFNEKTGAPAVLKYMNEKREMVKFLQSYGADRVIDEVGDLSEEGNLPIEAVEVAINNAQPGDTIIVRGGRYSCPRAIAISRSGEPGKPIYLMAADGEVPVFDFSGTPGNTFLITGSYWYLKGLTITGGERGLQLSGGKAHHNTLEQITFHDGEVMGMYITDGASYNIVLNCDAHHYFGIIRNGDGGDGISVANNAGQGNVLLGNQAWNNADDGIDLWYTMSKVRIERCYSFNNGMNIWNFPFWHGNGNGFKLGGGEGRHVLINCLAWGQQNRGFDLNLNTQGVIVRNCTGWSNAVNYFFNDEQGGAGNILRNNISYQGSNSIGARVDAQINSWNDNLEIQLTDNDFLSLDDSQMSAPRNPDGSIPYNNFLRLAPGSVAIDKGTDVGMPFVGARPDLGAFEYDPNETSEGYVKMLHQAVRDHDVNEINRLLAAGEGINEKDWLGYTPLHWAVYFGYPDLIELLISKGADPDIQSNTGRYALEIARAMAYPELESLLRQHGAKAGDANTNDKTAPADMSAF